MNTKVTRARIRAAIWVALVAVASTPCLAAERSLTVSTSSGLIIGTVKEIVLTGSYTLSELDWALMPLAFTGVAVRATSATGLSASLELRSGIPARTGYVTDSDYMNGVAGQVTHFSRHDAYTEGALLADARVGWEFAPLPRLSLQPFAELSFMRFKWTARDGYLQYPSQTSAPYTPWTPSVAKIPVYGTGIVYQQNYLVPAVGVSGSLRVRPAVDAGLAVLFSPLAFCNDLDNHALRLLDFVGTMSGGRSFESSADVVVRLSDRARLGFNLSYRFIWRLVGDTVVTETGAGGTAGQSLSMPGGSAAAFGAFGAGLSLELSL